MSKNKECLVCGTTEGPWSSSRRCSSCARKRSIESRRLWRVRNREKILIGNKTPGNTKRSNDASRRWRKRHPLRQLLVAARHRAKKLQLEFSITEQHLAPLGYYCECCMKEFGHSGDRNSSPTLDRIDNSKGYIPLNVAIICFRCNSVKKDCDPSELRMVANFAEEALCRL